MLIVEQLWLLVGVYLATHVAADPLDELSSLVSDLGPYVAQFPTIARMLTSHPGCWPSSEKCLPCNS